jgi:DNA-binding NarL/FixJ family response regulator
MTAPTPPWTPEEERLLRSLAAAGESAAAIAKRLKRSSEAVRKRAHKLEIRLAASQKGIGSRA